MLPWLLWQFCGFSVTLVVTWRVVLRFIASITSSILKKKPAGPHIQLQIFFSSHPTVHVSSHCGKWIWYI